MTKLGEAARYLRTRFGLSQRDAAQEVGISFVQLNNIENSKSQPSVATMEKYREAWGIDLYMVAVTLFSDGATFPEPLKEPVLALRDAWRNEIDALVLRRTRK